eukprot:12620783-Alexandrium_andersonii.AAC.1
MLYKLLGLEAPAGGMPTTVAGMVEALAKWLKPDIQVGELKRCVLARDVDEARIQQHRCVSLA